MLASRNKILRKALALFSRYGPRTTTMDDIAVAAGVSKKTLYKCFDNKVHLIDTLYTRLINHVEVKMRHVLDRADDAVVEFLQVSRLIIGFSAFLSPVVVRQLKQDNAGVYSELRLFKTEFLLTVLSYNIERGISCGLYKKEVDSGIMAHISLTQLMRHNNDVNLLGHQHSGRDIQQQLVSCILYGLTTQTGESLAIQYLSQYSKTI